MFQDSNQVQVSTKKINKNRMKPIKSLKNIITTVLYWQMVVKSKRVPKAYGKICSRYLM
jgi:hypothetical protein